ncbi:hypothetical protein KBI23_05875 [bacterium]|jgi:hypothetical protein|nr:hypothetical protein [bacterium]MBP9810470.1 hypothetical protein [bacterium]
MIKNKGFLVVPAYIAGIACVAAASQLLPTQIGLPIAAVLSIAMLTYFSLAHSTVNGELEMHLVIWVIAIAIACGLATTVFAIPGPTVSFMENVTWWQLAFVVTQQVFYFGIHAFTSEN